MPDAPSLRETLEAAVTESQAASEPVAEVEAAPVPEVEQVEAPEPKAEGQPRRPDGKFDAKPKDAPEGAPKATAPAPAKPPPAAQGKPAGAEGTPPPNPAPAGTPVPVKAPQSWKPQVRELAAKLPAEFHPILEESLRRENETNRVLQETKQAREVAQQTYQALSPYESVARARGMDAWNWAGEVLKEAAQLQMGPVAQRAPILARMLSEGGQDLVTQVAAILEGQAPAQAPQQTMPDPRAIFREELEALRSQTKAEASKAEAAAFLATNPEFVNDVLPQMNAIYAAAKADNRNVTMKQAYDEACWMNPDVRDIIQSRKAVESAKAQASTVTRARVAASSIRGSPTTAPRGENKKSLREEIEEAMASSSRT